MKLYTLRQEQQLKIPIEKAWEFLSTPRNLGSITPPGMNFIIHRIDEDKNAYAGQIISYKIQLFPWVKFNWTTEITHVKAPDYFVDEQRFGPYKFWHHQHILEENSTGVKMTDIVNYGVPFGVLGRFVHYIYIGKKIREIFSYRAEAIEKIMFPTVLQE